LAIIGEFIGGLIEEFIKKFIGVLGLPGFDRAGRIQLARIL
jgi:hypothetical protein